MSKEPESLSPRSFEENLKIRREADYQQFHFAQDGKIRAVRGRMLTKLKAFGELLPNFKGLSVLDIGCDYGFWCFLAAQQDASKVFGIDRNRNNIDLIYLNRQITIQWPLLYGQCRFRKHDLGKEWPDLGKFDFVFMCSVYHHVYAACGDHNIIWDWLADCVEGILLWEGPVDLKDPVSRKHIPPKYQSKYVSAAIYESASRHFYLEHTCPALHEPTRLVYKFRRKHERKSEKRDWRRDQSLPL